MTRALEKWRSSTAGKVIAAILLAVSATGCGVNTALTERQQEQDHRIKMAWIDKAVEVAERHGLAYRVELESTGRPSVGQSLDFYLNTGLSARMCMFGNGAAGRQPPEFPAPAQSPEIVPLPGEMFEVSTTQSAASQPSDPAAVAP